MQPQVGVGVGVGLMRDVDVVDTSWMWPPHQGDAGSDFLKTLMKLRKLGEFSNTKGWPVCASMVNHSVRLLR